MKKYMSFVLAFALIMCLAVPAMAAEDSVLTAAENMAYAYTIEERLLDAQTGFVDAGIDKDIIESINVGLSPDNNGQTRSMKDSDENVVSYGIRNLGNVYEDGEIVGTVYGLTATEKTISNAGSQSGVDAWLSLVWIDKLGTENTLVSVSGGWSANGHALTNRYVSYTVADYGWDSVYSIGSRPTDDTFNIPVGATGYAFTARSEVAVDGSLSRLVVSVETSIWD